MRLTAYMHMREEQPVRWWGFHVCFAISLLVFFVVRAYGGNSYNHFTSWGLTLYLLFYAGWEVHEWAPAAHGSEALAAVLHIAMWVQLITAFTVSVLIWVLLQLAPRGYDEARAAHGPAATGVMNMMQHLVPFVAAVVFYCSPGYVHAATHWAWGVTVWEWRHGRPLFAVARMGLVLAAPFALPLLYLVRYDVSDAYGPQADARILCLVGAGLVLFAEAVLWVVMTNVWHAATLAHLRLYAPIAAAMGGIRTTPVTADILSVGSSSGARSTAPASRAASFMGPVVVAGRL